MRILLFMSTIICLHLFSLSHIAYAIDPDQLILEITTELGVEKTVNVSEIMANEDIIKNVGGNSMLAISPNEGLILLIPWKLVKEVTLDKHKQQLSLVDTSKLNGTLMTSIRDKESGKVYSLATCSKVKVNLKSSPDKTIPQDKKQKWTIKIDSHNQTFVGYSPILITDDYYGQGNYYHEIGERFIVKVDDKELDGNISDFDKIILIFKFNPEVSVTAPNGKLTEGEFKIKGWRHNDFGILFNTFDGGSLVLTNTIGPHEFRAIIEKNK